LLFLPKIYGMTTPGTSDTNQEHEAHDPKVHGEASSHGHSGEGAASAFAHMVSQDRNRRRQLRDTEEPSTRNS
jgi:hypothetical protein